MSIKIYNSKKQLTAYALACGYISRRELGNGIEDTLWHEHGVYHVRRHDFKHNKRVAWKTFTQLTNARKYFTKKDK